MTLEKLMQTIFTRIAKLLSARWTGEITIRLNINRGGICKTRISIDENLTLD